MTLLGEDLSKQDCDMLASAFRLRDLMAGEVLLREGEVDDTLSIVVEGEMSVTRDVGDGEYVILHHLKPGDISGAMGFIDGTSHSATLRAYRNTKVITLHRADLENMIDPHPQLVYRVMRMIVRSVHATVLRMNRQFVEMSNYISKEHGRY